jgi:deoxycytidylate deaminase
MTRPTWDEYFLEMCEVASKRSTCNRLHVGSVIVKDHRVLSIGYNGSLPDMVHCNERRCTICDWVDLEAEIPKDKYLEPSDCPKCGLGKLHGGHLMIDGHCLRVCHAEEALLSREQHFTVQQCLVGIA